MMTKEKEESAEFQHPIDNEDVSKILEKAWKAGRWVVSVFVLDGKMITGQVVTNDFPHRDFDMCKTQFAANIEQCREYKITQAPMADMAQTAAGGMSAEQMSQFPPSALLGPKVHSSEKQDGEENEDEDERDEEENEEENEEEENADDVEQVEVPGLKNLRGKRR